MFARLGIKILLLVAAAALIFFGIGLLGLATAKFLVIQLGEAGAYAAAGGAMLLLVLAGIGISSLVRPRRPPPPPPGSFATLLLGALAKDLPWAAVLSTALAGVTEMLLRRRRSKGG